MRRTHIQLLLPSLRIVFRSERNTNHAIFADDIGAEFDGGGPVCLTRVD